MRKFQIPMEETRVDPKLPNDVEAEENNFESDDVNFEKWTQLVGDYGGEMKNTLRNEIEKVQLETNQFRDKVLRHDTVRKIQKRELLRNTNQDFKNHYKQYVFIRKNLLQPTASSKMNNKEHERILESLYSKINNILGVPPITESNSAIYDSYALSKTNDVEKLRLRYLVSKLEKEYRKSRKRERFLLESSYFFSKIIYKQQKYIDSLKKMYTQKELQVLKLKDLVSRISENKDDKTIFKNIK